MFKRKLFKRALPFILSVAMMFESLPATAMATESSGAEQMTETDRQSEEGGEERSGSGSEESAEAASTEERLSEESSGSESGSESEEAPTSEEASGSESGSESEASTPSGSETPSTSEEWSESGSESETPSTSEAETESVPEDVSEKETEEIAQKEVEAEETKLVTKLELDDTVGVGDNKIDGFTRVYGELPLTFTTEYGRNDGCGRFQEDIKKYIDIVVDDEEMHETAKANYAFKWTAKKAGAEGADAYTEAVDGVPTNVGEYKLHISLAAEKDTWSEASMDVYVKIELAELELVLNKSLEIDPGKTVKELKDQITKDYDLKYEDGEAVDAKDAIVEKFTVTVREAGSETDLEDTAVLNAKTGYEVRIAIDFKEKTNYKVTTEEYYKVKVGDLQETRVEAVLDGVAYPVTKVYGDASTALTDLFAKTAKVFVVNKDGDDKELTAAEGETLAVPGWYRREQAPNSTTDGIQEDGSICYTEEPGLKYVKLAEGETPEEAGEYYVIWVYAGDDKNAYKASASDPVAATIEPAPVVIRIANDSEALGSLFHEGMKIEDVEKSLREIEYKVSTLTDGKVNDDDIKTDDFFGVTYAGDDENDENKKEQYYKPLFKLQRAVSKEKDTVIEEKDRKWLDDVCPAANNEQLVNSDDDHEYVYRVIFTGNKGTYKADGSLNGETESVTNVATNAANRNYLAKVDTTTLEENAVEVKMAATKEAVIDYDPIVKAFNDTYKNPTDGNGLAGSPAVKVYDENALFANRAAYKQAQVKDGSNVVASATDGLTYTWRQLPLEAYEAYADQTDDYKKEHPLDKESGWQDVTDDTLGDAEVGDTEVDNGDFVSTASANVYELTIEYKDPEHNYWAKAQKVYFKVERQQIVIVPGAQVAQDGQKIGREDPIPKDTWRHEKTIPGLDISLAKAYKIPNNVKAEYDAVGEDKSSLEVTLPEGTLERTDFQVWNKEKNADGTNKDNYVETTHDIFDNKVGKYEYGVVATLDGNNYTTQYESEGVKENYTEVSEIKFIGENRLYVDIDMTKIPQDKQYDGEAITLPDGLVKIYSDQDMAHEITSEILNTTSEYDPEKVNLYWHKTTNNQQTDIHDYTTEDVIWGGEYTLALRFKGNETYRPITENVGGPADGQYYTYGDTKVFKNQNNDYTFKITPRDITITPQLKTDVKAGETVDKLLVDGLAVEGDLVEKDRVFFEHAEFATGTFGDHYINFDPEKGYFTEVSEYKFGRQYDEIDKYGGYPAFAGYKPLFNYQVNDKDAIKDVDKTYLRFGSKYAVKLDNALNTPLAESYNVTWNPATLTVSERGQGKVAATSIDNQHPASIALKYAFNGNTYTIKPREAAKFLTKGSFNYYDIASDKMVSKDYAGNYISYRIYAPTEFEGSDFSEYSKRFFYAEAITNVGGYLLTQDWSNSDQDGHYIEVLFPVTEEDKVRTFNIIWEEGYTETFQFEGVELEADLTKAVAPKTIKFNGVQSKMAVGETQQLDVKITKRQLGDVIKLQYRIAGTANETKNQFISVDPDTGIVTALHTEKKATTQIEAYPVYLENGKYVEITGKGVKTAKTKITVTDVTAPSIKKVIPQDETVKVQFTNAGNGYRREIYVIEAKKAKVTDFESRIAGMQNNQWEKAGFAVAPVYSYDTSASEDYDAKTKTITKKVTGLVPGKNYVVYVRNVSAARKLDDGSQVDLSFKGAVKNFVAVKSQVQDLEPYFNVDPETNTPIGKSAVKYLVNKDPQTGEETFKENIADGKYEVDLLSKSAQISVNGLFFEKYDGNTAAEDKDKRRYALPLTKPLQANYYNPKLTYGVFDAVYDRTNGEWTAPAADPWTDGVAASKYAAISNKGKITFKATSWNGAKTVYIYVKADTTDDTVIGKVSLKITANPTSVTGKKAKLKVGDDRELAEFLQYKQGKKKIPEYKSTQISISDEMIEAAAQAGYKIYDTHDFDIKDGELNGGETTDGRRMHRVWHIVAMSPNKAPFRLTVTDRTADGTEMTATVTLTAAALDPVKNLKKSYVDDKNITINFKHAGNPYGYEIALMDARKNVVSKKFVEAVPKDATSNMETWEQKRQSWIVAQNFNDVTKEWGKYKLEYFAKTDTFAYTIHNEKLVRLSSYTVSVTPVYDAQKGKTVTTKVKTTNIPAARNYNVDAVASGKGGITIKHAYAQSASTGANSSFDMVNAKALTDMPYFQSGNTYTLVADDTDKTWSKDRTTDKLTWKSSNTKVATIKANPGTYTATFKAVKAGDTTITVTSKITKKVIARYDVRVKAVGNGNGFSGGYEPTGDDDFYKKILAQWDPFYDGRLEVLSATDMLTVNADSTYDRTWVSFTAPTYGQYTFKAMVDSTARNIDAYNGKNGNTFDLINNGDGTYTATLEAGQKLYFKLNGSFTLEVVNSTSFARLTTANTAKAPLDVKANSVGGWIAFTAPEDNVYKFVSDTEGFFGTPKQDNKVVSFDETGSDTTSDGKTETKTYYATKGLKAGETLFIQVQKDAKLWVERREVLAENVLVLGSKDTVSDELTKDKMTVYAKFTALETGKYTFETETKNNAEGTKVVTAEIFAADGNTALSDGGNIIERDNAAAIAAVNADDAQPEIPKTTKATTGIYMDAGDTVFVKFYIDKNHIVDAFGDLDAADQSKNDKKDNKYAVSVKVSSEVGKMTELKLGEEQTVTKDTTKTFKFTVTENGKYQFNATATNDVKYFNAKYEDVATSGSTAEILVDDSSEANVSNMPKVKVGDTIYVEVKAGAAEDAKIIVSKVKVNALTVDKTEALEVTGNDSAKRWYTFTALEEGVYTFNVAAVQNTKKEGDQTTPTDTHKFSVSKYDKVFDTTDNSVATDSSNYTATHELKAGQTVVYTVAPSLRTTGDTKPEDVKTTINVTVKAMNPEAISTGDKEITLEKANDEVIYKFTAVDTDDYKISWTKKAAKDETEVVGDVTVTGATSLAGTFTSLSPKEPLYAGQTLYIKVAASAANAKGTLSITASKATTEKLESGVAKTFNFEKKAGEKTYRYIAPVDGEYGILVKLDENAGTVRDLSVEYENYSVNPVTRNSIALDGEGYATFDLKKGQTIKVTLSSSNTTVDVKGSITIQPTTPEDATPMTGNSVEAKVAAGKNKYYQYTIPAYGRYSFTVNNADVTVSAQKKTLNGTTNTAILTDAKEGYLFNKNDVVYLTVKTGKAAEQTATLKVEPLANVETLAADTEKEITMPKNAYAFYQFKAPERGEYSFDQRVGVTVESTNEDGTTTSIIKHTADLEAVYRYDDALNKPLGRSATLDKDEIVLIVLKAGAVDDTQFKYTVKKTPINVLAEGTESKVKIKNGESATFEFPVRNEGMYAFSVVGKGMSTSLSSMRVADANGTTEFTGKPENATYVVRKYDRTNAVEKFTVTYTKPAEPEAPQADEQPVAEAEVAIKVTKIEPVVLKADDAEKSIEINKGECAIVSFIPAVSNRYAFTTGNALVEVKENEKNGFDEAVLDKGKETYKNIVLSVKDNENKDNKKETAKVKVTTVKPTEITASPAAFKATDEKQTFWYKFKASKNARYDFEVTNGKDAEGEKVTHTSCTIEEFKNIRDEAPIDKEFSSKLMKKDDIVLIKVTVKGLAKDTDVKFNIKETEVAVFEEVVLKSTSGLSATRSFTAKKDELYTINVVKKGTGAYSNAEASYIDKDKEEASLSINVKDVELNIEADTKVDVTIKVNEVVKNDTVFYIFVEKKAKPAPEPEPSKPETPDQTETSSETDTSEEPETPSETESSSEPETPSETESSTEPEAPSETESSSETETSSETPEPTEPESPEVPESPDDTTTPEA